MGSAAWQGWDRSASAAGPDEASAAKLRSLYEALVPYLSDPDDPAPLYAHDGDPQRVFSGYAFEEGRLSRLRLRYPAYFTDGEPLSRARVEHLLHAKAGRGREYRFDWNEEDNHLTLTALAPLTTGIAAQRFVTSPGEAVLGFTDDSDVRRTIPVSDAGATRDAPPVVWRTGARSTEPHLLAAGRPGRGVTTLLRSLALQALAPRRPAGGGRRRHRRLCLPDRPTGRAGGGVRAGRGARHAGVAGARDGTAADRGQPARQAGGPSRAGRHPAPAVGRGGPADRAVPTRPGRGPAGSAGPAGGRRCGTAGRPT